jgi:arylsulfatase
VHNNYPWGWTVAGNTPFRRWKREVHEGGVADPLIVSWPAGIGARGEVRGQYVHAIDIAPTVLDVLGAAAPAEIDGVAQTPLDGRSFRRTFDDDNATSARDTQYFEMLGCRAIYHDGWKAVVYQPLLDQTPDFGEDAWELYHVAEDASECHDLATEQPDKLQELVALWWREAEANNVLPLDNAPFDAIFGEERPAHGARQRYVYYPFGGPVTEAAAVNVRNRSHHITAEVEIPAGGAQGILLAQGSILGGYVLFVRHGLLHYAHSFVGLEAHRDGDDRAGAGHAHARVPVRQDRRARGAGHAARGRRRGRRGRHPPLYAHPLLDHRRRADVRLRPRHARRRRLRGAVPIHR